MERYPNALVKYPSCTSIKLIKQQDENKDQWACIYENGLVVIWQTEFHNEKHYQFFKIGEENVHNSSVIDLDSVLYFNKH